MAWRPHPLGRIVLHPQSVDKELAFLQKSELGPDYFVSPSAVPRPEKNTLMTREWKDYFLTYRPPRTAFELRAVGSLTGVMFSEVCRFYAPWHDRQRERFVGATVDTRIKIQSKRAVYHAQGLSVHPPPDPWEMWEPLHVERADALAIERVNREGVKEEEEKEKRRETMGLLMQGKLAKMREAFCKVCRGIGGVLDGRGNLIEPCKACGGAGVES